MNPRTIRRWVSDGILTAHRIGPKLLRIDLAELDALAHPVPTVSREGDAA